MKLRVVCAAFLLAALGLACGSDDAPVAAPTLSASSALGSSPSPGSSPSESSETRCSPQGTELEIVAEATDAGVHAFDRDCLAAPAATAFTIRFHNRDADTHNLEILDHPGGTALFSGSVFAGPKVKTYEVAALDAGTYYFRCAIHPLQMNGMFLVAA